MMVMTMVLVRIWCSRLHPFVEYTQIFVFGFEAAPYSTIQSTAAAFQFSKSRFQLNEYPNKQFKHILFIQTAATSHALLMHTRLSTDSSYLISPCYATFVINVIYRSHISTLCT